MRKKRGILRGMGLLLVSIFLVIPFFVNAGEKHEIPIAPEGYLKMKNPFSLKDKDAIARGETLYMRKCKKCHGERGDGKGEGAKDLNPPVPAFISKEYNLSKRADGQMFWIIENGSKNTDMEGFGPGTDTDFSKEEIWKIITFIRSKFQK